MRFSLLLLLFSSLLACNVPKQEANNSLPFSKIEFTIEEGTDEFQILIKGQEKVVVTQKSQANHRPYLHPIIAPNSSAELTEYSPGHHKHQTGLYWGFTRVNGTSASPEVLKEWFYKKDKPKTIQTQIGRDYFHHPSDGYWRKVAANILIPEGEKVKWQTVYHMLDADGNAILEETQTWTLREKAGKHLLDLEWKGKALIDITINEFDYGGLFLRMPWKEGIAGEVVNAARQRNEKAEGQRAMWVDVGMEIEGLEDWGHIALFDHPDNANFPQTWRVDGQLGVGPVRARMGDWQIKKGETETIRHQLVAYSGQLNDVEMNELWADYVGDHGMYNTASLWNIARKQGREAEFLTPQEAVENMTIKDGYQVNAFAGEPMITQPMAFCWDDKGRMWIAENRDYESRQEGFANDGTSRILILEDTDHDGKADKSTVFLENIPFPSAIAVGFDGLYLGAPPNLLFVPDKNQDDKAETEDIRVLLTGWGIRDRHETINSFHWGPDGWLYGLEGFATPSKIRKPKGKGRIYQHGEEFPEDLLEAEGVDINGGVWRYHPIKDRFEVVAHGFSNPWGIDYDAKGQLFISACVIPHLFHIIPGGIYHRQGGRHFNSYVYQDIQTIVDHRHRSAHGGARVYLSDAFPEKQQGRIFMANIHEHAVLSDILQPKGSGFSASHGEDFMLANNAAWIGFSMELGPEGALYVLDWHDGDICGNEVLNKETGRVFRITPKESKAENWEGRYADLRTFSDEQLVELQLSKSSWHARRARVILQYRAIENQLEAAALIRLNQILEKEKNADYRLRALWTKHIIQVLQEAELIALLKDNDPYVRGWAVQFLVEDKNSSQAALQAMNQLAKKESSAVVRLYLAAALQRMDVQNRWGIAESLLQYSQDADDPNIPLMLWFAIESLVTENTEDALALARKSQLPSITQNIARRLVDANELDVLVTALTKKSTVQIPLLEGMLAGLEGRSDLKAPSNWEKVYKKLQANKQTTSTALAIAQQFGSTEAAKQMISILKDERADWESRKYALIGLTNQQRKELIAEIPALLDIPELRIETIRAVAAFEHKGLGQLLLEKYPDYQLEAQQEIVQTMASRSIYGWQLAYAIKDEKMLKRDIPAYIALQLKRVVGNGFVEIWGPIDEVSSDKQADFAKYQRLLSEEALAKSNPAHGKEVYRRTCWSCHKMYGEGGVVGPDLTGSNRANIPYLLSNIINPSGEIQDDYKMVVITTQDGRTYSGNITAENDRQITLRTVGKEALILSKSEIRTQESSPNSLMPEGLLNHLTEEEILDLVAYMRTVKEVEL